MYHRFHSGLINGGVEIHKPVTFRVDLPNGRYGLWMMGNGPLAQATLTIQGKEHPGQADDPRGKAGYFLAYDLDLIRGDNVWCRYVLPRNFPRRTVEVEVTDGRLTIAFPAGAYGRRPSITALAIYPLDVTAEVEREIGHLLSVTLAESVEAAHAWVQPAFATQPHGYIYGAKALPPGAHVPPIHGEFVHPESIPGRLHDLAATDAERARGLVAFTRPFTDLISFDTVPTRAEADALAQGVSVEGYRGQFIPLTVGVLPLKDFAAASLAAGDLAGPDGATIPAAAVDCRVERHDERWPDMSHENNTPYYRVPTYQVHRPAALQRGVARRFVADLRIPPDAAPGTYQGKLRLVAAADLLAEISLTVRVLPFTPPKPDKFFALPAAIAPIYLDYGFNTLRATPAQAKQHALKGVLVPGPHNAAEAWGLIESDAFQQAVAAGRDGTAPRVFYSGVWTGGHQWAKPKDADLQRLRAAVPRLDVMGLTTSWLWLTNVQHAGPGPERKVFSPDALADARKRELFVWLADAIQPAKELPGRFTFGVHLWRGGINGRLSFANAWVATTFDHQGHGNPYPGDVGWSFVWGTNQPMSAATGWGLIQKEPDGRWAVSRDLVNLREGITDYAYLQLLESAAAQGNPAATALLTQINQEFSPDLTRYYAGWPAHDGGGEVWYAKADSNLTARRLDELRRQVIRVLERPEP